MRVVAVTSAGATLDTGFGRATCVRLIVWRCVTGFDASRVALTGRVARKRIVPETKGERFNHQRGDETGDEPQSLQDVTAL